MADERLTFEEDVIEVVGKKSIEYTAVEVHLAPAIPDYRKASVNFICAQRNEDGSVNRGRMKQITLADREPIINPAVVDEDGDEITPEEVIDPGSKEAEQIIATIFYARTPSNEKATDPVEAAIAKQLNAVGMGGITMIQFTARLLKDPRFTDLIRDINT